MPLYSFLRSLLNVLVQIANKMGLQKKNVRWVPAPTAWRVLRLLVEGRPPAMEGSREYIE
jgi:hypothetical protein